VSRAPPGEQVCCESSGSDASYQQRMVSAVGKNSPSGKPVPFASASAASRFAGRAADVSDSIDSGKIYYNEISKFPLAWLGELGASGAIPPGRLDGRSIEQVLPGDLDGYDIAHFFAGIGVWSYAIEQSGWPRSGLVTWTASLPCQPFSAMGRKRGFEDRRHLWPTFFRLVDQCQPSILLGEQVAGPHGLAWLDVVFSDLEAAGYAVAATDMCAAGFGAPQRRQRLYWSAARLGDAAHIQRQLQRVRREESARWKESPRGGGSPRASGAAAGFWGDAEWVDCADGFRRPLGPRLRTLADGSPHSVDALRGFGNALNAEVAIGFAGAVMDALQGLGDCHPE